MAVNEGKLVFHVDLLIIAFIAALTLLSLPRLVARLSRRDLWTQGFLLRSAHHENSRPPGSIASGDSSPLNNTQEVQRGSPPVHLPAWSTRFHRLAVILRYPIAPHLAFGQFLTWLGYFGALLYAELYQASPFKNIVRAGYVASSQLPFVYALATKNNVIGYLIGAGYEKLNHTHQIVGIFIVLAANVHGIGWMFEWSLKGIWVARTQEAYVRWGLVALVAFDILFFFSLAFIRTRFYNIFIATHIPALIVVLIALPFHQPATIPYVAVAASLYGADLVARAVKTRIHTAALEVIPEFGIARLEMPELNAGWRAGQHVRVRILSTKMGWWGWTEMHPLTIASASMGPEGLVLMAKKAGRWTRKLYDIGVREADGEKGPLMRTKVKVWLEGPYGGPCNTVFESYSAALFVAGGSGITFPLASIQGLLRSAASGTSSVQVIHLVWVIQDGACLASMLPLLSSLLSQSTIHQLTISVFYTRVLTGTLPEDLPAGLSLSPCRPKLGTILDATIDTTLAVDPKAGESKHNPRGIIVGVCGPVALGQNVCRAVDQVSPRRRKAVGGVELHEEVFGW